LISRVATIFLLLIASSASFMFSAYAEDSALPAEGATLDILTFDDACLIELQCEGQRPEHFVEYFGADWCEPCKVLDQEMDALVDNNTFVMRHHPSPLDRSYDSDSNLRFNTLYRLLFIPTLIHNGEGLLTGTSQAQDLADVMSNNTIQFGGLEEVLYSNESLEWNTTANGTVTVWRIGTVAHETEPYNHTNMVIGALHFNSSDSEGNISKLMEMNGTGYVVMLESDGLRNLTVASGNPAAGLDLIENEDDGAQFTLNTDSESRLAILTTMALLLLLMPALVMWKKEMAVQNELLVEEE
jgi:thiol-disulfide isomerase/thioredoxin